LTVNQALNPNIGLQSPFIRHIANAHNDEAVLGNLERQWQAWWNHHTTKPVFPAKDVVAQLEGRVRSLKEQVVILRI
jgi:hypothetical protein